MASLITQMQRYGVVGVFNALFGYSVMFGLMWLGVSPEPANITAYILALMLAFGLNRQWVFEAAHGHLPAQAVRFVIAFMIGFVANYVALVIMLEYQVNPYVAQLVAGCCHTLVLFPLSRYFVFRDKKVVEAE